MAQININRIIAGEKKDQESNFWFGLVFSGNYFTISVSNKGGTIIVQEERKQFEE